MNEIARRVLVTGGAGFIGSNFVHYWLKEHPGERLVVLDALTYAGNERNLEPVRGRPELRFERGDICETRLIEELLRDERIDTIVHIAAESHVDSSIHGPDAFIRTNIVGTHSLLKAAREVWLEQPHQIVRRHRFHHVSTDEVYGSLAPDDPAFHERSPYAPSSPYSASKAASDHLVRAYHHTYGLEATISNCSNNYGPYHFPEKLVPLSIVHMLLGRPVPLYGDGRHVRDWLHVFDHCRGIDLILSHGAAGQVYNLGGGVQCENTKLVQMLCDIADGMFRSDPLLRERYPHCPPSKGRPARSLITQVKDRPGHDRRYAVDFGKAARELGFTPSISLVSGLTDTFRWYAENASWWRPLLEDPLSDSSA